MKLLPRARTDSARAMLFTLFSLAGVTAAGCTTETRVSDETNATSSSPVVTGEIGGQRGKPGAPVSIAYAVPPAETLEALVDIDLTVVFRADVDWAAITITGSESLEVVGEPSLELEDGRAGDTHDMVISVIPEKPGLRFVNVFAETEKDGHPVIRAFAIPVACGGDSSLPDNPEPEIMPEGRAVILMPAEEETGN